MKIQILLPDESDTRQLGARLLTILRPGDVLALAGDLGAGKTTLARGLIQAALGVGEVVPSPTFTLVQVYERPAGLPSIWHFDLYRLAHPGELAELGWDEALAEGVSLVEWPENAGGALPGNPLWLELTEDGTGRVATLFGPSGWKLRLQQAGWKT
jgi:tRNA threonylcarbamoyl adenosine modification protein YjeE